MKKKEVNINEESTSAGGAHAVNKFRISDFVMMAVIVILCASCVLPFLHVAVKSISGNTAVMSKSVYFWPKDITFDAYKKVFADNSMTYSMIFSVIVTVIFTALGMLVCTCAAYPLSKKRLKGKKLLTFLLMVPMYFSAGIIPSYLLYQKLPCAGYHVGVDLTSDLFPVQHADHEELLPEYDSRQLRGIRFPGWRK